MICTILTDGSELNGICRNEEEPPLLMVRSRLFTLMQTLVAQGYDEFWLNGEYGIPLWAAEFLLKLRVGNPITMHIAVPYEEQSTTVGGGVSAETESRQSDHDAYCRAV